MIDIIYSAPCVYNRNVRGYAEASIGYTGRDPVLTASEYIRQIPGAQLFAVVCNGRICLNPYGGM